MNIFIEPPSPQLPDFLSQSVKKKTKLNVYQFTFKQDIKLNLLKPHQQPFTHPAISTLAQNQHHFAYANQSEDKLYQFVAAGKQLHQGQEDRSLKFMEPVRYKSEQKLPILAKLNVELKSNEQEELKFIRVNRQVPKAKLGKMQGHFRHLSERNQVIRIKEQDNQYQEYKTNQPQTEKSAKDKQTERFYFIRNLILNSITTLESEKNQRASLNLLVSKLKQTERRGRNSINMLEKKMQQESPVELRTNRIGHGEIARNTLKQEIMKKFTKNLLKPRFKAGEPEGGNHIKKEENFVSGWNHYQNFIEETQQF